jgi:hypothetical protein
LLIQLVLAVQILLVEAVQTVTLELDITVVLVLSSFATQAPKEALAVRLLAQVDSLFTRSHHLAHTQHKEQNNAIDHSTKLNDWWRYADHTEHPNHFNKLFNTVW